MPVFFDLTALSCKISSAIIAPFHYLLGLKFPVKVCLFNAASITEYM